jgi:hypothetical protein
MIDDGLPILEKLLSDMYMYRLGLLPIGGESLEQFTANFIMNMHLYSSVVNRLPDNVE